MLSVRPKVHKLSFHLFGRSLHPELVNVHAERQISREHYGVDYQITSVGHVVTFYSGGLCFAEIAAGVHQPLPEQRKLMSHLFAGQKEDVIEYDGRVRYHCNFQLDSVDAKQFLAFQRALAQQAECEGLMFQFQSSGRMAMGALSYVNVETRRHSCRIRTFHTFPDTCTMVKSESGFELLNP